MKVTPEATIRVCLKVGVEDSEGVWLDDTWRFLFEQFPPPLNQDVLDATYVDHGVEAAGSRETGLVFLELKPSDRDDAVYYALDWLSRTIDEVNGIRRRLRQQEERVRRATANWYSSNVERT